MPYPERAALIAAALETAARGWPVFPLRPGDKPPALHGERRCPGTGECVGGHRKFEQRATTDPARIERCWVAGPFNVGVATGPAGLLVVDLDTLKPKDSPDAPDGATAFAALCERAGQSVPTTRRIRTPSGGEHLYFATPRGIRLPSSKGRLAQKIDTRAWGGYVVAPGSLTAQGAYTVEEDAPIADLPEWLQTALAPAQRHAGRISVATTTRAINYADTALERERTEVATALDGGREAALFRAARALGRFVAWGDLPRHVVEEALQQAGESAGLPPAQCRSTLRSALNWSIGHNPQRRTA
ncbi:bifunctional DNA primase/polymerase [Streptomyces sp. NPDC003300]|uniref:bifunctional DNA primase/polymerase n=1 Tax=unclassified Streptomyces TaxID=2593676 RepID=UPI0033AEAE8F